MLAALIAACCAANGVPLRDPRNPSDPELFHDRTLPFMSEMVTIVLLKDACTYAKPCGTCLRSFFLKVFFLPFFSGAAGAPAAPVAAAGAFAMNRSLVVGRRSLAMFLTPNNHYPTRILKFSTPLIAEPGAGSLGFGRRPRTNDQRL